MGAILGKFKKEKSITEKLERLEEQIQQIEKYTLNTQAQKKRVVGNFLAISIGIYVIAFVVLYFVYLPKTWKDYLIYTVPLFLIPFAIILLRKVFTWYFQCKLNKNSDKLTALRSEKKLILEQVMDKGTYKEAVNILARFGEKPSSSRLSFGSLTPRVPSAMSLSPSIQSRGSVNSNQTSVSANIRPFSPSLAFTTRPSPTPTLLSSSNAGSTVQQILQPPTHQMAQLKFSPSPSPSAATSVTSLNQHLRRRTPFPVVNHQDKGVFERIVDVLIGDGPQDRFAMICKECFAHNGMALKEEFDYATFRCAFCNALNPARKSRPVAPRLPAQQETVAHILAKHSSDSSTTDYDDSDEEQSENSEVPFVALKPTEPTLTADAVADCVESETLSDEIALEQEANIDDFKKRD